MSDLNNVIDYLLSLQNRTVAELEQLDGSGLFRRDSWERPGSPSGWKHVDRLKQITDRKG